VEQRLSSPAAVGLARSRTSDSNVGGVAVSKVGGGGSFGTLGSAVLVTVGAFGAGCSNGAGASGGSSPNGSDSGAETDSAAGGDTTAALSDGGAPGDSPQCPLPVAQDGICNYVPVEGATVMSTCAGGEPPTAQGGPIADGTYVLQFVTLYGGCPIEGTLITRLEICADQWQVAENYAGDAGALLVRMNFMAVVNASSVTLTPTCVANATEAASTPSYTASGAILQLIQQIDDATLVDTYQKLAP